MPAAVAKASILVVEDDPVLRAVYRAALKGAGYGVIAVGDGLDALRVIERGPLPAAVVLDLALPRLSGEDFQREIASHAHTRHIPIVVVAGSAENVDPSQFNCVLRKPVDADALIAAIDACIQSARRGLR